MSKSPTVTKQGALMKRTSTGKDKCWMHSCSRVPKKIITFFNQKVWVCEEDSRNDGVC